MSIEFKLPEVSEGVTSVDVSEVKVREGDSIEADAVVCEVETDKAVAEIPCPHAGRVTSVLIKSGDKITVGQPILIIEAAEKSAAKVTESAVPQAGAAKISGSSSAGMSAGSKPVPAPSVSAASDSGAKQIVTGTVDFRLPEVSEGVTQVDVAAVSVSVGDTITSGAVVCEVETDKAVAEIPCPHAGRITAVHVTPGETIAVGSPLVTIETTGAAAESGPSAGSGDTTSDSSGSSSTSAGKSAGSGGAGKTAAAQRTAETSVQTNKVLPETRSDDPPAPAGPATRRLARKLGVNLKLVKGSAAGGRITIDDVEAYVRERMNQPPAPAAAPGFGIVQTQPMPDFSRFGPVEKVPMNKIFRTSAGNLHNAWITIPHVTQHDLADITDLESARKRYVKANPNSPKITMTAIMIKAVVASLKAFPNFNSSVDMVTGELILKQYYHIGVAVDTPGGLVVPVIRNCDQKNVLQVAAELTDLAIRARDRKLKTEEMQGGTFTITNLGGIGGTAFTPIVNYPEVAILGMSRGISQLVMQEGQVTERLMLPLSLSYDHRAVNGADAARFIVKLSGSLTNFFELF